MAVWTSAVLWMASLSLAAGVGQNVARGKPAWMSTGRGATRVASNAVDGVTTATEAAYAVHTQLYHSFAWWKVDLQIQVQSAVVNIYFRTDYVLCSDKDRRNGLNLFTSGTNSSDPTEGHLCHSVSGRPDGTDISDVLNVTCPSTWRYLTAYTETDNDGYGPVLDFVEVQVWSCASGRYGASCSMECNSRHCHNTGDSCNSDTGACSNEGCQPGWAGPDCTACAPGYYGANCDYSCAARHCKVDSVCDAIHGVCVGGCAAGYRGTDCRQACASGRYGDSCIKYCNSRHCHNTGDSCPPDTGECSNAGCQPGWAGPDCTGIYRIVR
ncbi:multiple epidermal growth factor-like domains protein 6 isoform X2 [Haliotis rubra]|uniref:multiple epidermal growth factor-like domains protein 6 isoform X2 n=1 Tax=Haliotis rubra TaxID=36100 RepID=UPI001EE5E4E0|nr:multiple epidermal growth factor-like domains protein 6 isoform X2 [Haliotis rubra]